MSNANSLAELDGNGDQLSNFIQCIRSRNPFLDNRINGPSANDVDVDAIHHAAFARLTQLAREACDHRRGVGAVLWGEAGIGKSHLLSRLGRWANNGERAYFAYLHNLQAAPENLPRSLLSTVLSILTNGRDRHFAGTPLFNLVYASLLEAVDDKCGRYTWGQVGNAYGRFVQKMMDGDLPGTAPIDCSVWKVLFRFIRSAYRATHGTGPGSEATLAVRWLSGQALDPEDGRALKLPPPQHADEAVALLDNQQIKQVLVALTRLAACKDRPFLLVFDQVDNLDEEQAGVLARFLEALIDSSSNLLVVTAGVKDTLVRWHENRVIQESAWDRLAQLEINLQRLKPEQSASIVEARLCNFLGPFAGIELVEKRRREDALFPLGDSWRQRFLGDRIEVRPRDAINWAREGWRQQQEALTYHDALDWLTRWPSVGGPKLGNIDSRTDKETREAVDCLIAEKLASIAEQLQREPHTLPADAGHLAGLVYSLLIQCRDAGHRYGVWEVERVPPPKNAKPTYHLSLRRRAIDASADIRTAVLFLLERSATSVAAYLRRLLENWGAYDRVVVATAEQVGLPLGQVGRDNLDDLRRRGGRRFQTLELRFADLVELEALQRVVGLAKSRDLEIELSPRSIRAITEQEVVESYHRQDRYLASPFLRSLLDRAENGEPVKPLQVVRP
ncbi:MAG TPA: AAA family ATPase [Gemmataceae bacterium]|nr:AAA family ATPase [Gemmataceae bacterium]